MKNLFILFTSALLLAACATQPKTTLEKPKETPTASTADDWEVFEYNEQNYSIQFPKTPMPQHQMLDTEMGKLDMRLFMCEMFAAGEEEVLYGISAIEYPMGVVHSSRTDVLDQIYRGGVDGAVGNLQGTLISEEKIDLDGFEGRAIKANFSEGMMLLNSRMYLIGNRMYTLQVIHEANKDKSLYVNRFFDSFKIDEAYKEAARQGVATTETDAGWRLYESKNGGYNITFPQAPIESENAIDTGIGQLAFYSTTSGGDDTNTMYMTAYVDYPDSLVNSNTTDLEEFYANVINGSATNTNGKVSSVEKIELSGMEGREAKMDIESQGVSLISTLRVFLIANRMYMIQAIGEKGVEVSTEQFMDSFRLIE